MYADTLKLIVTGDRRRPSPRLPERLDGLFRSLGDASGTGRAERIEDEIWRLWMAYRDSAAAFDLERATRALTALDFPAAEGILARLVAAHPDFAEAWNKRATLYFLMGENEKSLHDCDEVMKRNPAHFGALAGYGQIYLRLDQPERALTYFRRALRINPNMRGIEQVIPEIEQLLTERRKGTI